MIALSLPKLALPTSLLLHFEEEDFFAVNDLKIISENSNTGHCHKGIERAEHEHCSVSSEECSNHLPQGPEHQSTNLSPLSDVTDQCLSR